MSNISFLSIRNLDTCESSPSDSVAHQPNLNLAACTPPPHPDCFLQNNSTAVQSA